MRTVDHLEDLVELHIVHGGAIDADELVIDVDLQEILKSQSYSACLENKNSPSSARIVSQKRLFWGPQPSGGLSCKALWLLHNETYHDISLLFKTNKNKKVFF